MALVSTNVRLAIRASDEAALAVLAGNFAAFTALVASFTLTRALNDLFLAQDFELIAAAPVSLRQIIISRIGEIAVQNIPLAIVFTLPAIVVLSTHAASQLFLLFGLAFTCLQVAIITAASCMVLLLLTYVIPARLLKQVIYVVWTVGFLGIYIWTNMQLQDTGSLNLGDAYTRLSNTGLGTASAWAAKGLYQAFYGNISSALTYLLLLSSASGVAVWVSARVLGQSLYVGRSALGTASVISAPRSESWLLKLIPSDYRGIAEKEYLTFGRDVRELTGILYALTLVALFAWRMNTLGATLSYALLPTAFFAGNLQIRTSLPAFGREGRQWLLLQASPITPRGLLLAKFIPWAAFSGASSLLLSSLLAMLAHLSTVEVMICGIFGAIVGVQCVVVSLYLGAVYADFSAERPEEYVLSAGRWGTLILTLVIAGLTWVSVIPAHQRSAQGYAASVAILIAILGVTIHFVWPAAERTIERALSGERETV